VARDVEDGALVARERVGAAPVEGAGHVTRPARDGATSSVAGLPVLVTVFSLSFFNK
jgi:hypothetical protein